MEERPEPTSSIFELLADVRKRPAMYLGFSSIRYLKCFLDGWYHRNSEGISDAELFGEFTDWVSKKYKAPPTQNWARIIDFWSSDEVQALELFYKLLDEFQAMNVKRSKKKFASK